MNFTYVLYAYTICVVVLCHEVLLRERIEIIVVLFIHASDRTATSFLNNVDRLRWNILFTLSFSLGYWRINFIFTFVFAVFILLH
jgi:hypothetical protein